MWKMSEAGRVAAGSLCFLPAISASPIMPAALSSPYLTPILLLIGSNVSMTLTWSGHLRFKEDAAGDGVIFVAVGHRLHRVLHGGAGEPLGRRRLYDRAAQDHPGDDHAAGVRRRSRCST